MKFGTSGLRGLSTDLEGPVSSAYAAAFGRYLLRSGQAKEGADVLLGKDLRPSSPAIAANCSRALSLIGFRVIDCGEPPTPALALYGLERRAAALMVTGSHIPADRNGIKFYRPDGEIDKQDEEAISALANDGPDFAPAAIAPADHIVPADHAQQCLALFREKNIALLPKDALKGLRLGVYQHSTVARDLLVDVLAVHGAKVVPLGRSPGFVPVDTEAVSIETVDALRKWSREFGLDAIVSADGDGDRPLVADEAGTPLRGDLLGLVAANFLKADVVVTPVTSNSGLEAAGAFVVTRTRVGSPYVIAAMQEALAAGQNGVMGFEANGGVLTASDFEVNGRLLRALPTRDCFLPILAVLALRAERRRPLSEIAAAFRLPVAASDRLESVPTETSAALMEWLRADRGNLEAFLDPIGQVADLSDIDGLRVALVGGRTIHLRPSGNAPEMRCYVEAETASAADALLRAGLERIGAWTKEKSRAGV